MNRELVELDKNKGIVTDDNGNIRFISKESNNYNFKDILKKENELESKKNILEEDSYKLKENKLKCSLYKVLSILIVIAEVLIFLLSIGFASPLRIVVTMVLSFLAMKGLTCCLLVSTKKERKKEKKKLIESINKLESEISLLEKELEKMKEISNYKVIEKEKQVIEDNNKIYHDFSLDYDFLNDKPKVKVK